jgi:hypothetical protein
VKRWTTPDLIELAATIAALLIVVRVFGVFANAIELRPGVVLGDPVLAALTPRDMTGVIFATMYLSLAVALRTLPREPRLLIDAIRAYAIVVLLRMLVMAVAPLEAPPGTIPLEDPLVRIFVSPRVLTRDLFFSGHTAMVCVLLFSARSRPLRLFFAAATVVVGVSVLVQAVHYTVDVLAAPVFAYAAHRVAVVTGRAPLRGMGVRPSSVGEQHDLPQLRNRGGRAA